MVLANLKKSAEDYLGKQVNKAVITVPTYFNDNQRQATKNAGIIAGLNVLRLINQPVAAGIAYGVEKKGNSELNLIVFDFGGNSLNVSLLKVDQGIYEVIAVAGDEHLGGQDLDRVLVEYCCSWFISPCKSFYNLSSYIL